MHQAVVEENNGGSLLNSNQSNTTDASIAAACIYFEILDEISIAFGVGGCDHGMRI